MTEPNQKRSGTPKPDTRRGETRQRILAAAAALFRQHGIDGVGVDAVMKQAGLTHGGFYFHFPSKEALVAAVSQSLLEQAADRWDQISRMPDRTAALERIVLSYLDPARINDHACPLTTLGPDVARRSTSREAIGDALRSMIDALEHVLRGQQRNEALVALSTLVGAVVLSRLADDAALARDFLESAGQSLLRSEQEGNHPELLAPSEQT